MKISARDIQVFVAGVFAYQGFQALIWMPHEFQHSRFVWAGAALLAGIIGLFVGIGLLFEKPHAIRWALAILWFCTILDAVEVGLGLLAKLGVSLKVSPFGLYQNAAYLITFAALLGLMLWSRSSRFQVKP
jgi:hypothetical protein